MTPKEQIIRLKRLLYREAAMNLLNFQRAEGEERRSWDDLSPEEQDARMDFAEHNLMMEDPEVFA